MTQVFAALAGPYDRTSRRAAWIPLDAPPTAV
jgi:hypothetical protein